MQLHENICVNVLCINLSTSTPLPSTGSLYLYQPVIPSPSESTKWSQYHEGFQPWIQAGAAPKSQSVIFFAVVPWHIAWSMVPQKRYLLFFLMTFFWPRGEMADFAKTSPWSSRLDGRLCVWQKGWKVPYRSGKVIWSKIGNSKKITFLKIILVDFFKLLVKKKLPLKVIIENLFQGNF